MSSASATVPSTRSVWITAASLFIGSAALAALMSPSVSLWTDEAVTISAAERSLGELWALVQRIDSVHALYYAFMSIWVDLFGTSSFSLRFPSALAAGGTTLGVYFLTRLLGTNRTALAAGVAAATLPRLVWGGIEARPFIFSALAAVWATYLLVRAIRRRSALSWVAYGVIGAVGVATNIYLVMVILGHAITVLVLASRDRRTVIGFGLSAAGVALLTAPLLLLVRSQQAQLGGNGDRNPLSIARKIVVNQFFLGETPDPDGSWFTRLWQASAIVAAGIGMALLLTAIIRRSADGDNKREFLAVALPWIVVPTGIVAIYAVVASPIYQPRYFTFTAPAAAILIAVGVRALTRRWLVMTAVVVYVVCIAVVFVSQRTPFAKSGSDWSAVAETIARESSPGDAVFFAPRYADDGDLVEQTSRRIAESYPRAFEGLIDVTLVETGAQSARLDGFSRPLPDAASDLVISDRVWAIFHQRTPGDVLEQSEELFDELGFAPRVVWDGPTTLVVEYTKAG